MNNYEIAEHFSLLAKLIDIHGENSFKSKSYSIAAFNIEKLAEQLNELKAEEIYALKGIGEATGKKIIEILETGNLKTLEGYLEKTPQGVREMLSIKGLGPKKINIIWKEIGVDSLDKLLESCENEELCKFKGFTKNTEAGIIESIKFYQNQQGIFLYAQLEEIAKETEKLLRDLFQTEDLAITGAFRRHEETIHELEFVVAADIKKILGVFETLPGFNLLENKETNVLYQSQAGIRIRLYSSSKDELIKTLFITSSTPEFAKIFSEKFPKAGFAGDEEKTLAKLGLQYIQPFLREEPFVIELAKQQKIPKLIEPGDIRGMIHTHSTWSDGAESVESMVKGAIARNLEYLVLSDHSKSAFYANGLSAERIVAQHKEIDQLNKQYANFRIFKSIESDILSDGSLDYDDEILKTFELVIASVHSNLTMTEEKAMKRLIKAIENPFTTILGHMTGRQLLRRKGYPVDHKKIIDACAANKVVIELNANPVRLDMDYHFIQYALEKNVLISVNPDAHAIGEMDNNRYGVLMAQKGLLTKESNLSSFNLEEFEKFLEKNKKY